jgi:hypothetical protein
VLNKVFSTWRHEQPAEKDTPVVEKRRIDPNDIFPDDDRWDEPAIADHPVAWLVVYRGEEFLVMAHGVEVMDGHLCFLDEDEDVFATLPPSAWSKIRVAPPEKIAQFAVQEKTIAVSAGTDGAQLSDAVVASSPRVPVAAAGHADIPDAQVPQRTEGESDDPDAARIAA